MHYMARVHVNLAGGGQKCQHGWRQEKPADKGVMAEVLAVMQEVVQKQHGAFIRDASQRLEQA